MDYRYVDMSDFSDDVYASALKFAKYAQEHAQPRDQQAWLELAYVIGIPQDHLEMILARMWSKDQKFIHEEMFARHRH